MTLNLSAKKSARRFRKIAAALALKTGLSADFPTRSDYVRDLASSYSSRGTLRLATRKATEAEQDYREALRLLTGLPPEQCAEDRARLHSLLGALWTTKQPGQAAAEHEKAIALWRVLRKQTPGEPK